MHLGSLGEQIVLISQKAFENIKFMGYENADSAIYYERKIDRDAKARADYKSERAVSVKNELFMLDIMREEIKNDDARLR